MHLFLFIFLFLFVLADPDSTAVLTLQVLALKAEPFPTVLSSTAATAVLTKSCGVTSMSDEEEACSSPSAARTMWNPTLSIVRTRLTASLLPLSKLLAALMRFSTSPGVAGTAAAWRPADPTAAGGPAGSATAANPASPIAWEVYQYKPLFFVTVKQNQILDLLEVCALLTPLRIAVFDNYSPSMRDLIKNRKLSQLVRFFTTLKVF